MREHPDHSVLAATLASLLYLNLEQYGPARELLTLGALNRPST